MRIRYAVTFGMAALLALSPVLSLASVIEYHAHASGAEETSPTGSAAQGTAVVTLDTVSNLVTWDCTHNVANQTASHFHNAAVGVNGPVVIGIGIGQHLTSSTVITDALKAEFLAGRIYYNVHSTLFPGGEIRGQLLEVPTPVMSNTWGRIKTLYR